MMLHPLGSEEVEFNAKTDFIKLKYSHFNGPQSQHSIPRARRPPLRAPANRQAEGEEEFRWLAKDDDEGRDSDSGISSPKMWGSPSPAAPSTSDAQRIAGYRQEMMDLVRGAPESAYELSLKDMVDMPKRDRAPAKRKVLERRISSKSESMKSGVFLKMFFPFSLGGDRKSGGTVSGSVDAKKPVSISSTVSPKSTVADGEKVDPTKRSSDGDWWSKSRFRGMSSSSSSNGSSYSSSRGSSKSSSINSTGSIEKKGNSYGGGRKEFVSRERKPETNKWKMSGCYSFFRTRRSKSKGHDDTIR